MLNAGLDWCMDFGIIYSYCSIASSHFPFIQNTEMVTVLSGMFLLNSVFVCKCLYSVWCDLCALCSFNE